MILPIPLSPGLVLILPASFRIALIPFVFAGVLTACRSPEGKSHASVAVPLQAGGKSGGAPEPPAAATAISDEAQSRPDTLDVLRERLKTAASFFDVEPERFGESRLRTIYPNSEMTPRDTSWRGNVLGERRFMLPGTFSDITKESPLSCRTALLDAFVNRLFRETEIRRTLYDGWEYAYSRPLAGDTVLASLGCREFAAPGSFHRLEKLAGMDSARWVPMSPTYVLSTNPRKSFCGDGLVLELRIEDISSPRDSSMGFLVESRENMPGKAFPFQALSFGRKSEMPDPSGYGRLQTIEIVGSGPSPFERVWVEQRTETIRKDEVENEFVVEARLFVALRGGAVVELAASHKNDPTDAGIIEVISADLDLDGHPDFIVKAEYLETRVFFLDAEGIRESVILQVAQTGGGCC